MGITRSRLIFVTILSILPLSVFSQTEQEAVRLAISQVYRQNENRLMVGSARGTYILTKYTKGQNLLEQEFAPKASSNEQIISPSKLSNKVISTADVYFAYKGNKSYNEFKNWSNGNKDTYIVYGGKNTLDITAQSDKQRDVSLSVDRSSISELQRVLFCYPIENSYFSDKKIFQLMDGSSFKYKGESNSLSFGKLVDFSYSHKQGNFTTVMILSFALKYGYTLVKLETNNSKNQLFYEVLRLGQQNNIYTPIEYEKGWNAIEQGKAIPVKKERYKFDEITFDNVEDTLFNANLKLGDNVLEIPSNSRWTEGENGERIYRKGSAAQQNMMSWGWLFMASVTTLLVMTVLAYVRWKSKQWSKAA